MKFLAITAVVLALLVTTGHGGQLRAVAGALTTQMTKLLPGHAPQQGDEQDGDPEDSSED